MTASRVCDAEEEGFEPTCPFGTPVFKTGEPPLLNSSNVHPDRIERSSELPQSPTISIELRVQLPNFIILKLKPALDLLFEGEFFCQPFGGFVQASGGWLVL